MSEETPPSATERAEAAATRRRWITLAEFVGVAGLLIAALGLWLSYSDRRSDNAERQAAKAKERAAATTERARVGLVASAADNGSISFKGVECTLQSAEISFPASLNIGTQSVGVTPQIDSGWVAGPLLKLTDGGADRLDGRMPVLIDSRCEAPGGQRHERAIYDLPFRIKPEIFGRSVQLRGLVWREATGADGQQRIDTLWAAATPSLVKARDGKKDQPTISSSEKK